MNLYETMSKTMTDQTDFKQYWYWQNTGISHETCQKIINLGEENWEKSWQEAGIGNPNFQHLPVDKIRKSDIVFLNEEWIYELICPFMKMANKQAGWKYNIKGLTECQLPRYTKDGFYTWHKDALGSHNEVFDGSNSNNENVYGYARKLSMTVVLNSDFEGGEFQIGGLQKDQQVPPLKEGSIIVFPSFIDHRIKPVTKGVRYSLVAWFLGPPFV